MDRDRFDALAKSVAAVATRRSALSLLSAFAVVSRSVAPSETYAKKHKRKKKCKKKNCSPCRTCKKGKCKPKAPGTPCGDCHACDVFAQCAPVADNTPCDDGNPCTINDVCTNGVCAGVSGNQGSICGTSTHGGTAIRCCNGACPDPNCVPSGTVDVTCDDGGDCTAIDCCAQQLTTCNIPSCFCFFAQAGEPCGSDRECSNGAAPATACICGTCQVPPP